VGERSNQHILIPPLATARIPIPVHASDVIEERCEIAINEVVRPGNIVT